MLSTIPIFKAFSGVVGDGIGFLEESNAVFQQLSKVGAGFNGDLGALRAGAADTRLPLGEFASLIGSNSELLAGLGAGVNQGAKRFAQLSHEYLIEQLQYSSYSGTAGSDATLDLNFNHPVKELVWVVCPSGYALGNHAANTYSALTGTSKLQLNGHDRFAERNGTYFSQVQPYQHHTNVPKNGGINVYSFAIKPEEHQPSGTCNFSRIDNAQLVATVGSVADTIFAVNYNVLRIM